MKAAGQQLCSSLVGGFSAWSPAAPFSPTLQVSAFRPAVSNWHFLSGHFPDSLPLADLTQEVLIILTGLVGKSSAQSRMCLAPWTVRIVYLVQAPS